MKPNSRSIATCNAASEDIAILELKSIGVQGHSIAPGILLCEGEGSFESISKAALGSSIAFIRHVFPVQFEIPNLRSLGDLVSSISLDPISTVNSIAAQVRIFGSSEKFTRQEVSQAIENYLKEHSALIQRKNPDQAFSLVVIKGVGYGGICDTASALSSWPGGEIRLRKDEIQISRAESKLIEACEVFGVKLLAGTRALDLGAAPGGWSRVLSQRDISVVAVDPAELAEACYRIKLIKHVRATAQQYLAKNPHESFSLIVNDMRIDAEETASITCEMIEMLTPDGKAIVTLKLQSQGPQATLRKIADARRILEQSYRIKDMRQLFHNRNEVTVLAQRS